jgi:hypothetical protein
MKEDREGDSICAGPRCHVSFVTLAHNFFGVSQACVNGSTRSG